MSADTEKPEPIVYRDEALTQLAEREYHNRGYWKNPAAKRILEVIFIQTFGETAPNWIPIKIHREATNEQRQINNEIKARHIFIELQEVKIKTSP
jgi:hypothetical protein